MNQPQIGSFEHIPLGQIRPSTTNPRKYFDQAALEELTQSVREMGVTVPIHVRSTKLEAPFNLKLAHMQRTENGRVDHYGYELVTGERRFRAATAAGLPEIPAIVHDGMSDADAMDLQLVENLQRADLHPVEEADGYRALMAHGESAEDVAKKAGKTLGYVQQRLKLLTLEVDAKQLFAEGHLTLGHALLLARLTPKDQERALRFLLYLTGDYERAPLSDAIKQRLRNHKSYSPSSRVTDLTELQLKDWIGSHVLLQLKGVPWDLGDAELVPIAGACTTCPKRTGANQALFADITTVEDTCVDSVCFGDKQKAFTLRQQELAKEAGSPLLKISAKASNEKLDAPVVELKPGPLAEGKKGQKTAPTVKPVVIAKKAVKQGQWVKAKRGECTMTVQAIAVDGADQGKTMWVCADQGCKVHKHEVARPRSESGHNGASRSSGESWEDKQKRRNDAARREMKVRLAMFSAILPKLKPTAEMLRPIVLDMVNHNYEASYEIVCGVRGWAVKENVGKYVRTTDADIVLQREISRMATPDALVQLMVEIAAAEDFGVEGYQMDVKNHRAPALAAAKKLKVDLDKVITKVEAELAAAAAGTKVVQPAKPGPAAKKSPAKKASASGLKPGGLAKDSPAAKAVHALHTSKLDGKQKAAGEREEQAGA